MYRKQNLIDRMTINEIKTNMEEELVSEIDNEFQIVVVEDTELLNISSKKLRSVLKG